MVLVEDLIEGPVISNLFEIILLYTDSKFVSQSLVCVSIFSFALLKASL